MSLAGFHKHKESCEAPPPLTAGEEEAKELKQKECGVDIGASTKRTTHAGLSFPLTDDAVTAVENFKAGGCNYLQLVSV